MAPERPDGERRPAFGRARDPLMQEVRWRLFRREDLPARLRRLERLEDAASRAPVTDGPPPEGEHTAE